MTVSTMLRFANAANRFTRLCLLLIMLVATPVLASGDAAVRSAAIVATEDGYVVNADFSMPLNPRLVDALMRGVSLYFNVELIVERPRRFWFDAVVAERKLQYRLSYHPITRSFRLTIGSLHRGYDTLEGAMMTLTRVRNWQVFDYDALTAGTEYRASLRMHHDKGMLPRPLVASGSGTGEWSLATDWVRWSFSAEAQP